MIYGDFWWKNGGLMGISWSGNIHNIIHNIPYPWPIEIDYKNMMIYRTCTWRFSISMLNLPQGFGVIEPSNPAFTGPLLGI